MNSNRMIELALKQTNRSVQVQVRPTVFADGVIVDVKVRAYVPNSDLPLTCREVER